MENQYIRRIYADFCARNQSEGAFCQAVREVLVSLEPLIDRHPEYEVNGVLERFVEPEHLIVFQVPWTDDRGRVHVNRGYKVQFNSAIGPYRGGLRFQKGVSASVMKFLGFEQTLRNSLTDLPLGGGSGGSDFDPHGRSDNEIRRFCQSFMTELYRYTGSHSEVPLGGSGVGPRELGYLYGQYRRLSDRFGSPTVGTPLTLADMEAGMEAAGHGLCYFADEMLRFFLSENFDGKRIVISGSGSVALSAAEKATELGGIVVAMSDSEGFVEDEAGIDLVVLRDIKLHRHGRIREYAELVPNSSFTAGSRGIWGVKCDIALPCATENELDADDAGRLIRNGVKIVCEGANMPCTGEAVSTFRAAGVPFGPSKAANAGGVCVSGMDTGSSGQRLFWSAEEADQRLRVIMAGIFVSCCMAAAECGAPGDLVLGANAAGFRKVADAMLAQASFN